MTKRIRLIQVRWTMADETEVVIVVDMSFDY